MSAKSKLKWKWKFESLRKYLKHIWKGREGGEGKLVVGRGCHYTCAICMRWQLKRRLLELRGLPASMGQFDPIRVARTNDHSIYYFTTMRRQRTKWTENWERRKRKQKKKSKEKQRKNRQKATCRTRCGGKSRQDEASRGKSSSLDSTLLYGQCKPLNWTRLVVVLVVAVAFLSLTKRFCLTHSSGLEVGRPGSARLGSTCLRLPRCAAQRA